MDIQSVIRAHFARFPEALQEQLTALGEIVEVPEDTTLIRYGQYIKVVPLVLDGVVKVMRKEPDREFLLYFITPGESCIMSYAALQQNSASQIEAISETKTIVLLLNREAIKTLREQHPAFSQYFLDLYHRTYGDLLTTIDLMIFGQLDKRLLTYLRKKAQVTDTTTLSLTHQSIAQDLGTAREVISRMLKKLEKEGHIALTAGKIVLPDAV